MNLNRDSIKSAFNPYQTHLTLTRDSNLPTMLAELFKIIAQLY